MRFERTNKILIIYLSLIFSASAQEQQQKKDILVRKILPQAEPHVQATLEHSKISILPSIGNLTKVKSVSDKFGIQLKQGENSISFSVLALDTLRFRVKLDDDATQSKILVDVFDGQDRVIYSEWIGSGEIIDLSQSDRPLELPGKYKVKIRGFKTNQAMPESGSMEIQTANNQSTDFFKDAIAYQLMCEEKENLLTISNQLFLLMEAGKRPTGGLRELNASPECATYLVGRTRRSEEMQAYAKSLDTELEILDRQIRHFEKTGEVAK